MAPDESISNDLTIDSLQIPLEEGFKLELLIGYFRPVVETVVPKSCTKSETLFPGCEINDFLPMWQVTVW